jgi:hypothetical protein
MTNAEDVPSPSDRPSSTTPDWSQPLRCRDRSVRDREGRKIGHVDLVLHAPDNDDGTFFLVVLGSVSRFGNEARAIPVHLLAEMEPGGDYLLLCQPEAVRASPIHVEGSRCACSAWFNRVRDHFAGYAPPTERPSGKTPHSSAP